MPITIAFDVYGTLIDTHGIVIELEKMMGENAVAFSQAWREKQLEYSFRRGLMRRYEHFSVCTQQALDYSCNDFDINLSSGQKQTLLTHYATLPAFADTKASLSSLKSLGIKLYAFSNGSTDAVERLLLAAKIDHYFNGVVSVDSLETFKPDPAVYAHFLKETGSETSRSWLVSSNTFDVIGARSVGMHAAWIQRSQTAQYDPWGIEPTVTLNSLNGLADMIKAC